MTGDEQDLEASFTTLDQWAAEPPFSDWYALVAGSGALKRASHLDSMVLAFRAGQRRQPASEPVGP